MSENIRVLNTGPNVLLIDRAGHSLAGGETAEAPSDDPETARHLSAGRLVRVEDPRPTRKKKTTTTPSESGDNK
ncbi:hypothetical protein SEA_ALTADENA_13 [Arthrobacter phage Altadena]|uniref:Uncharacterized protein n=1 Tax=Arthrobacter phage Altadena TaxID=3059064 RepID=A0AA96HU01_9CAUD|nr:hypothetical protein SEA_ALTADENA_13 [Arthrobacter phage Altadena]